MTRRLIATGQRPVTVGTFFSLGHSTYSNHVPILVESSILIREQHRCDNFHCSSLDRRSRLFTIRSLFSSGWHYRKQRLSHLFDRAWNHERVYPIQAHQTTPRDHQLSCRLT